MADDLVADEFKAWNETPWSADDLSAFGVRSVIDGGRIFCPVEIEPFAISGVTYRWKPGSKIKWGTTFSKLGNISDLDVKAAIESALKEIEDATQGIRFAYEKNPDFANIYIIRQRLDAQNGILADANIPRVDATPEDERLRMRLDDSESWVLSETPGQGEIDFYRVFLHEALHCCGLGHAPANLGQPALIAPTYSRTLRNLQVADKAELVRRYGQPAPVVPLPPAPPPTPPVPGSLPVNYEGIQKIEQGGKVWQGTVKGVLARVK